MALQIYNKYVMMFYNDAYIIDIYEDFQHKSCVNITIIF